MKNKLLTLPFKHIVQKFTRGFDDSDLWNLDETIIKFLIPRLEAFRELKSRESNCELKKEQQIKDLSKIINALYVYSMNSYGMDPSDKQKVDEGLQLFAKILPELWD